jgi:hypothetical protein
MLHSEPKAFETARVTKRLTQAEWEAIAAVGRAVDFRSTPITPLPRPRPAVYLHPSGWLIEFRNGGVYQLVSRLTVVAEPELKQMRLLLLKAAGFHPEM